MFRLNTGPVEFHSLTYRNVVSKPFVASRLILAPFKWKGKEIPQLEMFNVRVQGIYHDKMIFSGDIGSHCRGLRVIEDPTEDSIKKMPLRDHLLSLITGTACYMENVYSIGFDLSQCVHGGYDFKQWDLPILEIRRLETNTPFDDVTVGFTKPIKCVFKNPVFERYTMEDIRNKAKYEGSVTSYKSPTLDYTSDQDSVERLLEVMGDSNDLPKVIEPSFLPLMRTIQKLKENSSFGAKELTYAAKRRLAKKLRLQTIETPSTCTHEFADAVDSTSIDLDATTVDLDATVDHDATTVDLDAVDATTDDLDANAFQSDEFASMSPSRSESRVLEKNLLAEIAPTASIATQTVDADQPVPTTPIGDVFTAASELSAAISTFKVAKPMLDATCLHLHNRALHVGGVEAELQSQLKALVEYQEFHLEKACLARYKYYTIFNQLIRLSNPACFSHGSPEVEHVAYECPSTPRSVA